MNDPLHRHLEELADAPPADALWSRVAAARNRQLRRQRSVVAGGAMGCALLAAIVLAPRLSPAPGHAPRVAESVPTQAAARQSAPDALQRIDRELQLAYARNADDDELAALWTVRRDLARTHSTAAQPVGI